MRSTDYIQTYTGHKFWPLEPEPEDVFINDIAHALSQVCRWTGHCIEFFSVAQHCIYVSRMVGKKFARWGLLHDAAEAYLCDVAKPIKPFLSNYQETECQLMKCIAERFNLGWPVPKQVHDADLIMLATERRDLLTQTGVEWPCLRGVVPESQHVMPLAPRFAEVDFLDRFSELFPDAPSDWRG